MSVLDVMALDAQQVDTLAEMLIESGQLERHDPEPEMSAERWRASGNSDSTATR